MLDAYCGVLAEVGAPVVKARTLLAGTQAALRAGYRPRMTLVGLGIWESEGFRSPRQIEEWVEKAALRGGEPQGQMTALSLLVEGNDRYRRFLGRKVSATPSKAEQRRQRSLAAIRTFNDGT